MTRSISVATDFSRFPAGRFYTDGPYSGEKFREEVLRPLVESGTETIEIDLDGTAGYGSSFLEEAFGGLVRVSGISAEELLRRIVLKSEDPARVSEIKEYVRDARPKVKK